MTLTNPTALITAVSNSLGACAAWTAETGTIWYPSAPADTALPFAVIQPDGTTYNRIAAGSIGIPAGSASIQFHFAASAKTQGQAELFAEQMEAQLVALQSGLFIRSATGTLASDPDDAAVAAGDAEISIIVTIEFGLE